MITSEAAQYQGPDALDYILNYPMYGALVNTFAIPGQKNTSAVADAIALSKTKFKVLDVSRCFIRTHVHV